jgi:hypothetical protein
MVCSQGDKNNPIRRLLKYRKFRRLQHSNSGTIFLNSSENGNKYGGFYQDSIISYIDNNSKVALCNIFLV